MNSEQEDIQSWQRSLKVSVILSVTTHCVMHLEEHSQGYCSNRLQPVLGKLLYKYCEEIRSKGIRIKYLQGEG